MYQNFQFAFDSTIELKATLLPNGNKRDLRTTIIEVIRFLHHNDDLHDCTLNYHGFTFLIESHFKESDINKLVDEYKFSQVAKDSLNTAQVDPNTRFHVNQKCTHESCISCDQTVFN